jgi:DNA end-binding protein Ku
MSRSVWSGSLSFGLVTLPVGLVPATEPKDVRFHLYDGEGRRVRYRRVIEDSGDGAGAVPEDDRAASRRTAADAQVDASPNEASDRIDRRAAEREIAWEEISRGVEDEAGGVVLLEPRELEALRPRRSRTIEVEDFVDLAAIDPVYFEKSYYVVPASLDGLRPYALLLRAMERAGQVGIGRFVLRTKPHLVAIRPMGAVLALETLFFGDEVRDAASLVPLAGIDVDERELQLAERLIQTLRRPWDPGEYADTYREELLRALAEKRPVAAPGEGVGADAGSRAGAGSAVDDLMRALRESVEAAKARGGAGGGPRRGRRRAG